MPFILYALSPSAAPGAGEAGTDGYYPRVGRVGCPRCTDDGTEISRLLQRADFLHSQFRPHEALKELLKVLKLDPDNHEALAKIARAHIDIGDMIPDSEPDRVEKKLKQYAIAERYARRAIKADPDSTWGYFYVAASLGKIALGSSIRKQIDLSGEIREAVEKAIALDPDNGFAYHIYGVWHRKVAEIGQLNRALATVLFRRSVPQGSLEKSVEYLSKAIALNPTVIVHRLEIGKTYIAMGKWDLARKALEPIQELPIQFSNDSAHKKTARELLEEIRNRSP